MRKGMSWILLLLLIGVLAILMSNGNITGKLISTENKKTIDSFAISLATEIARLPEMNLDTVDNYKKYKEFADNINTAISIINDQTGANIPLLETTTEGWHKLSKKINRYGPLINEYNSLVTSAKRYEEDPTRYNLEVFYKDLGAFSLEMALILSPIPWKQNYEITWIFYRMSGLYTIASKCPSCIKSILSTTHWTIRSAMVEEEARWMIEVIDSLGREFMEKK